MKRCNGNCNQGRSYQKPRSPALLFGQGVAFLVALLLFLGLAGRMDYEDAKLQEQQYCEMVQNGKWPDYDGNYREVCLKPATDH